VFPGGETRIKTWKIKPWDYEKGCQRPMNPEASKVNGVTDDMLVNCPTFYECAPEIAQWLKDSDLAGFNSSKFDLPMLAEEFERAKLAGLDLHVDLHEPLMVDVQNIFHTMEPRNLKAAYRFYCGGADFDNAHTAEADTVATYEVLKAQLDRYSDTLKNNVKSLAAYAPKRYVDFAGTLIYNSEQSYFKWIQQGNFSLETKAQFARLEEEYAREKLCDKFNVRPLKPETRK